MVSYELTLGTIIASLVPILGNLHPVACLEASEPSLGLALPLAPLALLLGVTCLAETNRPPFDLPEAEAELVAGYFVEYGSVAFALFFIGEYAQILLMSALWVILFFGGALITGGSTINVSLCMPDLSGAIALVAIASCFI